MECNDEIIENIRREILEKCRKQHVTQYQRAMGQAQEKVKDFLALRHPEEFLLECEVMDLHSYIYQDEGNDPRGGVRRWVKSVGLFTNYIVKKGNLCAEKWTWKRVSSLWDAFIVHNALQHLGPIGTPQVIKSERAEAAFASIHTNQRLVKNKHIELSEPKELEVEVWRWAYGERRKQHRELVINRLNDLMSDLRQIFQKRNKPALVSITKWANTTDLAPMTQLVTTVREDLSSKDQILRDVSNSRCEKDSKQSLVNKWLQKKNSSSLNIMSTSNTKAHGNSFRTRIKTFEETAWPSYVVIGAHVRYKKFPKHTYVVKSIVGSTRVLHLTPSNHNESAKCFPPKNVIIKSPLEIEDVCPVAEPLFAVNVPTLAMQKELPQRKVMNPKVAGGFAVDRNSSSLNVVTGTGEEIFNSPVIAGAHADDKSSPSFLNILDESGCHYQPKPRVIRKRARPFEESSSSETEYPEQESPPSLEIISLDMGKKRCLLKPRENPIVISVQCERRNPIKKVAPDINGRSNNLVNSLAPSSPYPQGFPNHFEEESIEEIECSPKKRKTKSIRLDKKKIRKTEKVKRISDDAKVKKSWLKLLRSSKCRKANNKAGKRLGFWTKAERTALWDGLMVFPPSGFKRGVKGCWSHIKEDPRWRKALAQRTTVQMKDKARPWIKSGALEKERKKRKNRANTS